MDLTHIRIFLFCLFVVWPVCGNVIWVQKQDWIDIPPANIAEGDVECFSEYMELWIHRMRIEGLRLWLSAILRIQVTLTSLESLNHQLSACGFGLHKDPDRNYIFRVMYSGCFVQLEHNHYMIALNLVKRISRFGGRTHSFVMKCPVVASPPNREHIQCDPDSIQVTREIPVDSWKNELSWSLALRGSLVVALEDASLIQVNVNIQKPDITVQSKRNTVLSPVQVLQTEGHFLPLKLVSGYYAYSLEATCPSVIQHPSQDTVLHIYKRRMGLTKRGGYDNETLSVSSVSVNQTDTFRWSETSDFVHLVVPTARIQKTKKCSDKTDENLQQTFYRIDVMLTFKETNNKMFWTMENTSPCLDVQNSSVEAESHRSPTPEPPLTFATRHTSVASSLPYTGGQLFFAEASTQNPQSSSQSTEEALSKTMNSKQFLPATTESLSTVSPLITSFPETDSLNRVSKSNEQATERARSSRQQVTTSSAHLFAEVYGSVDPSVSPNRSNEANMESDTTPMPSLSSYSSTAQPEKAFNLTPAYEASSGTPN